jgi:hypothetical protein
MKITHINIQNFCGIRAVDVALNTPLTLFAGHNHAGKTSLIEAIKAAMTGNYNSRIHLKKDAGQLVTDGAKKGSVQVITDGFDFSFALPACSGNGVENDILAQLINTSAFAARDAGSRRKTLFNITGCKITPKLIFTKLAERGCNSDKYEVIDLAKGLEAANKYAEEQTRDARASWKAITGEAYGSLKAESWTAPKFDIESADTAEFTKTKTEALQNEINQLHECKTRLTVESREAGTATARIAELTVKSANIDRIKAKLTRDQIELKKWEDALINAQSFAALDKSLPCPCCQNLLVNIDGKLVDVNTLQHEDSAPSVDVAECQRSITLFKSAVTNDERDLALAENAAEELAKLGEIDVQASADNTAKIATAQQSINDKQKQINELNAKLREADVLVQKNAAADSHTVKAAQYHADVNEWSAIAEAFSAGGIQAEILASALDPFNALLRDVATATGWAQVAINADMDITANGRAYALLSESEKWRADTALAYAISQLSGLKLFVLDRVDVLDTHSRLTLLKWLHGLAQSTKIDTVILCGTFKELPKVPATFSTHWLENGVIATVEAAA